MEDGGFTLVMPEDGKKSVTDGVNSVKVANDEEVKQKEQELVAKYQSKKKREAKEGRKDFYKF